MALTKVAPYSAALTVNGTATGYATVPDNTRFPVGSVCNIAATGVTTQEVIVTEQIGSTVVGLKPSNRTSSPVYGRMDLSAFTVALAATLAVGDQYVSANPASINVQVDPQPAPVATTGAIAVLDRTVANLGGAATYTGPATPVSQYKTINAVAFADQAGNVFIEQSFDPAFSTVDASNTVGVVASTAVTLTATRVAPYARLKFVNGATPQTVMRTTLAGSTI